MGGAWFVGCMLNLVATLLYSSFSAKSFLPFQNPIRNTKFSTSMCFYILFFKLVMVL